MPGQANLSIVSQQPAAMPNDDHVESPREDDGSENSESESDESDDSDEGNDNDI